MAIICVFALKVLEFLSKGALSLSLSLFLSLSLSPLSLSLCLLSSFSLSSLFCVSQYSVLIMYFE
jgi:hypothetical protein